MVYNALCAPGLPQTKETVTLSPKCRDQRCLLPHPANIILINVNILGQTSSVHKKPKYHRLYLKARVESFRRVSSDQVLILDNMSMAKGWVKGGVIANPIAEVILKTDIL